MSSSSLDKRSQLLAELERLSKLPPQSVFVRHRTAVVRRALELLSVQRSPSEEDELTRLLGGLAL